MPQSNPQDFRWSLIEHPQSTAMIKPEDDHWITFRQPVKIVFAGTLTDRGAQFSAEVFGTYQAIVVHAGTFVDAMAFNASAFGTHSGTNPFVTASAGTDRASIDNSFGNINTYNLFDFVNSNTFGMSAFGTYLFAVVPTTGGTNTGTFGMSPFGTYITVVLQANAGTNAGTFGISTFGTALEVVFTAEAGTNRGTFGWTLFGTAQEVTVHAGTYANHGTLGFTCFGQYTST